jgi:hypothetical protein
MAKSKLPSALERRHLIERELSAERAIALADAYLEEDRVEEAIVFLGKADAHERLEELLKQAVASGDVFAVQAISRAGGADLSQVQWQEVAANARAAGKEVYAETADRQAHRGDN